MTPKEFEHRVMEMRSNIKNWNSGSSNPEHFWLVVRETEGDDFLPMDWERLKSYKNGVKVYHKK